MQEDQDNKEDKFDAFTAAGEALGYISLEQARVLAIEHARDNTDFYGPRYSGVRLVWEVVGEDDGEDYYDIRLSFRPAGRFRGEPGIEQFIIDKNGEVRVRQMLDEPTGQDRPFQEQPVRRTPRWMMPAAIGLVVVAVVAVSTALLASSPPGDPPSPTATPVLPASTVSPVLVPSSTDIAEAVKGSSRKPTPAKSLTRAGDRPRTVHVADLEAFGGELDSGASAVTFLVRVVDAEGLMVSGARLTAQLATPFDSRVVTTVTGEDGIGEVSEPITGTGRFEITIIDIQGAGLSYSPAANLSSEAFLESGSAEITVEPDSGPSGTEATLLLRSVKPDAQYQVSQSEAEIMDEDMEGGEAIFSRAVEGCRGDVVNFTALIQTYSGPQEREASFTITDPLCQEVHVDGMDAFYEVFEGGDTEVLFLVEIVDAQGRRDSVGAVWVLWMIEGPEGFLTEADARTNESGVAEFRETVSEPGTYVFTVVDLAGEGIEYDRSANEVFGHKIDVAVFQGYTTIEGEKGLISAQIPAAWSYSTELMEGASVLYAAPDLPSWIDAMERSEGVEGPGFAIALFPVPSAEGPVTLDLLHELLDEVSEISNCGFAYRQELFTEEGEPFGLQEELECEGGGSLISSVKFDPSSPFSFLVFFARLVSDEDFAHYKRSLHTLRWEPLP